jgi:hypothetical protein
MALEQTPEVLRYLRVRESTGAVDGAVTSDGTTKTVASSFKSLSPRRRAKIDASIRTPSDGRLFNRP